MENNSSILVTRSSMPDFDEYVKEIRPLWDSHWLTNMGEKHNLLEKALSDYLMVRNVSLFTNGHMALELALQSLALQGEVITTPFTFASTTHAIVRNNLTPVFCDINENDFTLDVSKVEALITEKTSAIVPVHVFGNICNVEEIEKLAKKYNIKVIYDAAHAFGVEYKGKGVTEFGDLSMLSFHATKVFNTIEGGAICYNNDNFTKKLYSLKNFGIKSEEIIDGIGCNAKMNEFQAAMGLCNLRHVDEEILKRKKIVEKYREKLSSVQGIRLAKVNSEIKENYSYFPIVINEEVFGESRNELFDRLKKSNISVRKYFYPLTNSFDCYKGKFDPKDTPIAHKISNNVITLPLYADLSISDVERICSIVTNKEFVG